MAQTKVTIRMDEDLKKQFDDFCSDVGMTMTTAFCVFAKTVVRERKIPFEVKSNTPNADTIAAIEEAEQMKKNPQLGKKYDDVDAMMRELLA